MQFKTNLLCYFVPARASGVYKEAEKIVEHCQIYEALLMN